MKDKRYIYLAASCAACVAMLLVVPHIRAPKHVFLIKFLVIGAFMFVQLNITRWLTSIKMRPLYALAVLAASLAAWAIVVYAATLPYARYDVKGFGPVPVLTKRSPAPRTTLVPMVQADSDAKGKVTNVHRVNAVGRLQPSSIDFKLLAFDRFGGGSRVATNLLAILAASAFGYLLSFILRHPNIVLPVCGLAAYVDVWTVIVGPTAKAIEKAPHVVSAVSVSIPMISSDGGRFEPMSYIGPADVIFLAMFFGAVYRLKMEPARTFWIVWPILTFGMALVEARLFPIGLPALPLIGLAVIAANYKHFKLTRQEWSAIGITAVLLVAASFVLMPIVLRR